MSVAVSDVPVSALSTPDPAEFRDAMARFPSGVTIVTTYDGAGDPCGFTANSFCSVSADPPLVLVCLAHSAHSFSVFDRSRHFAVSMLSSEQNDLAVRFGTAGPGKFAHGGFVVTTNGSLVVDGAPMALECVKESQYPAGDHSIIVGRVHAVSRSSEAAGPAVYVHRGFTTVAKHT